MGGQRYIDVSFYDDAWVQELDPSEKFMYMYLLTNPLTNIAGVYKITPRRMSFDTGFNVDTIKHILHKFEAAGKVYTKGEYIIMKNWCKHQKIESANGKVSNTKVGIDRVLSELSDEILVFLVQIGFCYEYLEEIMKQKGLEGAYKGLGRGSNYLDLDSNLDSNLDLTNTYTSSPSESDIPESFDDEEVTKPFVDTEDCKPTAYKSEPRPKQSKEVPSSPSPKAKKSTQTFSNSDYLECLHIITENKDKLSAKGLYVEGAEYTIQDLKSRLKKKFSCFGVEKTRQGLINSVNNEWLRDHGYPMNGLFSDKMFPKYIANEQSISNGTVYQPRFQQVFDDKKERTYDNIEEGRF